VTTGKLRREEGMALLFVTLAMLLMAALGAALVFISSSETMIAANFYDSYEALYAADAALERAMGDLSAGLDWTSLPAGSARSGFVDGLPSGRRRLSDGSTVDLNQTLNMANCQKAVPCSASDLVAVTAEHPWGANNPVWQFYAYGWLSDMLPTGAADSPFYVMVLVADDQAENDGDPSRDGSSETNPGTGVLALRAHAFGPRGAHRVVDLTVARTETGIRILSWREGR
jgi:Tfp pilus assembly protein PilX